MSIARKIAHKAEAAKGSARKTAGRVTGSRDQANGNLKQAQPKIKDAFSR